MNFGVIVPVGPSAVEVRRFRDLLDSLWAYEPGAGICVAIDTGPVGRDLVPARLARSGCRFLTLGQPYHGLGEPLMGRLSAGILLALRTIHEAMDVDFVLRLDTDALIIGPFLEAVGGFLRQNPDVGMTGTLGCTCRREAPYYGCEKTAVSDVVRALEGPPENVARLGNIGEHLQRAIANGYAGKEYCQGGAYVLTGQTVARMAEAGYLRIPEQWVHARVPEDVMIGMYTRAVGLRSADFSEPGEPFANHHRGLPYSTEELVRRGCSVIHSVKRDPDQSEAAIRRFFRQRRPRGTSAASA